MNRKRLLLIGASALLVGSFSSYTVFRSLQKKMFRPVPGLRDSTDSSGVESPGHP